MSAVLTEELVSVERAIPMRRVWAMPNKNTFDIPPIRALVKSYLAKSTVSVDPFARNKRWATYTNDLNPDTAADSHMEAAEFLGSLLAQGVRVDLGIFDPPYSPEQIVRCYQSIGLDTKHFAAGIGWARVRDVLTDLVEPSGIVICCGWNTVGMGIERGYKLEEILLVSHGREHNDTIVTVERKVESAQSSLFSTQDTCNSKDNDLTLHGPAS